MHDLVVDEPVRGTYGNSGALAMPGLEAALAHARGQLPTVPLHHLTGLRPVEASLGRSTFAVPITGWLTHLSRRTRKLGGPQPGSDNRADRPATDREHLAARVISAIEAHGPAIGVTRMVFQPGMLVGTGGVAYQLLRMHPDCDLPSVLLPDPGPAGASSGLR